MNKRNFRIIIPLALLSILAIIGIEVHWLNQAIDFEETSFDQKVHLSLLEVVKKLYADDNSNIPVNNPIQRISKDYYVVDINRDFDPEILDFYLKREFELQGIRTDFIYAIYDCESDKMVYGNTVEYKSEDTDEYFPKFENLVYYFSIRFPSKTTYLFTSLKQWILISVLLFGILIFSSYFIFVLIQQKKYADLQKDFINNMTHEFKNPLSSILIASNYIHKNPENKNKIKNYSQLIVEQSQNLNRQIERVLNLAETENQAFKLKKERVFLAFLLEKIVDDFKLKHPKITLEFEQSENTATSLAVCLDTDHFTNVVHTILDNSIKYSENNPRIEIKFKECKKGLSLSIQDHGKGISKTTIKHVFKKFYRVNQGNNAHKNGFGLGLFYAKKICDLHGIEILCESKENIGTKMTLIIPRIDK